MAELFKYFAYEDFVFILLSILREKSVVFISKDISLITAVIMTFVNLIKPFSWPFPSIFSLPESCVQMLDSPIPVLIGLNQPYKYVYKHI